MSVSRPLALSAWAALIGLCMAVGARLILWLIAGIANLVFLGRLSVHDAFPVHGHSAWHFVIPALGGLVVGLIARYGSRQVQGHGIPEAMEQVLLSGSKIKPRMLLLKPLSTCVVIGTGGPFGAEGVVIASGGALGSVLAQLLKMPPLERKTLLAAGAAAGLSAAFSCPVSAVLLAVELLLFEFHPRSLIPVALASACAAAFRVLLIGPGPMFEVPPMPQAGAASLPGYLLLGAVCGLVAVLVVKGVHYVEHAIESIPLHWTWKPALGGLIVGVVGLLDPRVFGPGYPDISAVLSGRFPILEVLRLGGLKLAAWIAGVGSATSSGTLAPLLLIGTALGSLCSHVLPFGMLDPSVAALAGMAAFFGGMSGAFLASVVLAFEATWQPAVLMPLLAATTASYLVSRVLSRENIMTQKFMRQGLAVPAGLTANPLDWIHVAEAATQPGIVVEAGWTVAALLEALGVPTGQSRELRLPAASAGVFAGWVKMAVIGEAGAERIIGDLVEDRGAVVAENATLREAARRMIDQDVDRLAVLSASEPGRLVGIITQREIVAAYRHEEEDVEREAKLGFLRRPWA